jgi:Holliday junction resolvase RusA-like endonuclease
MAKDTDNLLKFVMDALQTIIVYATKDHMVLKVIDKKHHTPVDGFAPIQVEPYAG